MGDGRADGGRAPAAMWTLRDMIMASLAAVALLGLAVVLFVLCQSPAGDEVPEMDIAPFVMAVFAAEALLVLPAWWWGPRKYGGGWARLGLRGFGAARGLLLAGAGLLLYLAINVAWDPLRRALGLADQPAVLPLFGGGVTGLAWALLLGAVVAPVAEEVFFRGFLYAGLRGRWGLGWGLAVSALIFGLAHLMPGVLVPIALLGVVLAWLYEVTGSLWPSILLHMAINGLALVAAYVVGGA